MVLSAAGMLTWLLPEDIKPYSIHICQLVFL